MLYLVPNLTLLLRNNADPAMFGLMQNTYNKPIQKLDTVPWKWMCDNSAFTRKFIWDHYKRTLDSLRHLQASNICITCPDVVGDAKLTYISWLRYHNRLEDLGYNVAYVLQDGLNFRYLPDVKYYFVGGTNLFKDGQYCADIITDLKKSGKYVHVGRVNTDRRFEHFYKLGIDSCDGTQLIHCPALFSCYIMRLNLLKAGRRLVRTESKCMRLIAIKNKLNKR